MEFVSQSCGHFTVLLGQKVEKSLILTYQCASKIEQALITKKILFCNQPAPGTTLHLFLHEFLVLMVIIQMNLVQANLRLGCYVILKLLNKLPSNMVREFHARVSGLDSALKLFAQLLCFSLTCKVVRFNWEAELDRGGYFIIQNCLRISIDPYSCSLLISQSHKTKKSS